MASTASALLKLELQTDGENDSTWGALAVVLFQRVEEAIAAQIGITVTGANYTLDDTQYVKNSGTTAESHAATIKATGTLTGDRQVIVPLRAKHYMIWNATGGAYTLTVIGASGTGVIVPQGYLQHVFCDGTNVEAMSPPLDTNGQIYNGKGADIASASPTVIGTDGDMFDITGTTGFSAFTVAAGRYFTLQFDGILTMTHGAGTLDLPGAANITTAAGDTAFCYSTAANVVQVLNYKPVAGIPASFLATDAVETAKIKALNVTLAKLAIDAKTECIAIALGDETTATAAATEVATFHMPYPFTLTDVILGVTTAPTGAVMTADLNEAGSTVLSTKVTIDAGEKTSGTAATPPVISDATLAANALMTVDIDGVGSTVAGAGAKIYLIGYQT